ncbi:MAG: transketolase [Oscillospiraceae bacterium]|nr:transketolase [Oscillospiraceae bacterium]
MKKDKLALTAAQIRRWVLEAVYLAKSGHIGGSLSLAEILSVLYWEEMKVDPQNDRDPDRDRFVLSKGHCSPGLYAALGLRGYFDIDELNRFRTVKSNLSGHPEMNGVPGVDMSTGSLGQGLSVGVGMAIAAKLDQKDSRVFCVLGDGEIQEGQIWEAAMSAAHYKLDNLVAILDNNNLQISGEIDKVLNPYPLDEKFAAFGFKVIPADGHDFDSLRAALAKARQTKGKPSMILAKTVKGKGVSFMENNYAWHGAPPNKEQYEQAASELDKTIAALEKEVG